MGVRRLKVDWVVGVRIGVRRGLLKVGLVVVGVPELLIGVLRVGVFRVGVSLARVSALDVEAAVGSANREREGRTGSPSRGRSGRTFWGEVDGKLELELEVGVDMMLGVGVSVILIDPEHSRGLQSQYTRGIQGCSGRKDEPMNGIDRSTARRLSPRQ